MKKLHALALGVAMGVGGALAASTPSPLAEIDSLIERGLYQEALGRLDKADKVAPELVAARRSAALTGMGKLDEAEKVLAAALAKDPKSLDVLMASAELDVFHRGGEPAALARAGKTIAAALAIRKDLPTAWTMSGYLALAERRDSDAVGDFLKVVEGLDPKAFQAWHGLARAQIRLDRIDKARTAMRKCLEEGPAVAENHWMAGNVELAAQEDGSTGRALQSYLFAVGLADWVPKYKGWAIMTQLLMHDYGQAAVLERVLRGEAPQSAYLAIAEGIRYELKGDVVPARENYLRAVQADWTNPWARWCLANIYLGCGNREFVEVAKLNSFFYAPFTRPEAAAEHLAAIETLAPEFPFRGRIQAALQKCVAIRDRGADPAHQKKIGELKQYLSAIRQSPAKPKW